MEQVHIQRFKELVAYIKVNPDEWDQGIYHSDCLSAHCLAGLAELKVVPISEINKCDFGLTRWRASGYLGLTCDQAHWLFHATRTLEDFEEFLKEVQKPSSPKYWKCDSDCGPEVGLTDFFGLNNE